MSFTVAPALVQFKTEELQNAPCGVVVMTGHSTKSWNETGTRFYGISLAPTRKKAAQHIAVAVGGVCTAIIDGGTKLHLGTKLYVKKDKGKLTKDDNGGANGNSVGVFLQRIDRTTARVWLTHMYEDAASGNLPTYGFGGPFTAEEAQRVKRLKRSEDDGLEELYRRIDAARD